jgi:hypothetical protein
MKLRVAAGLVLGCGGALVAGAIAGESTAYGRAQTELPYAMGEAFSTAVRFVRIDKGCRVVDKDAEAAFVTFECAAEGDKVHRGSFELIKTSGGVRAQVSLGDETHGMELRWLELYERKLRDERGAPVPPSAPVAAPAKAGTKDGGA